MSFKQSAPKTLTALLIVVIGILVALYGGWRMDRAVMATRHLPTVGIGLILVFAGTVAVFRSVGSQNKIQ